jgi:hypothetical protein
MLVASIPYKFSVPWGASATSSYINTIPETGVSPAASQALGFPPATSVPAGAGGTPPAIGDFNGALNYATLWTQWLQAGAPVGYDSAFSTAIGGYPNGAILASATFGRRWISTVDNNTSNPNTGGANWMDLFWNGAASLNAGTDTGTVNAIVLTIPGITNYAQLGGVPISFIVAHSNTGPATVNINGLGAQTIYQGGAALSGREIAGGWLSTIVGSGADFILLAGGNGAVNVQPATAPTHAVNKGQITTTTTSTSGVMTRPDGTIVQWAYLVGPFGTSADTGFSVTFPNAFPNNCLFAMAIPANAASNVSYGQSILEVVSFTQTQLNLFSDAIAGAPINYGFAGIYLYAIGN